MLSEDQVKTFKKIYDTAFNKAKTDAATAAATALKADKDFKSQFLNVRSKKEWSIYQKNEKTDWTLRKLTAAQLKKEKTPSGNTIATYTQAYNDMIANNKKLATWKS